ncbi:MAG: hypothetical protein HXS41_12555 [Theionarchaea archaeon]|nr:hypothetical protein [Theionarchaea archaeon]
MYPRKEKAALVTFVMVGSLLGFSFCSNVGAEEVLKLSYDPDVTYRQNYDPQIAADSSGNCYVVWHGSDGYNWEIYWVKVDAEGIPGTIQMISTHPDNVGMQDWGPQIALDGSGNSYVVWRGYDGHDNEIYWVKVDAQGVSGTVQKISTHPDNVDREDFDPQIAADGSGNSYVVWRCRAQYHNEIYWVKVDAQGVSGTVQKISTHPDNQTYDDWNPQIAVDGSGNSYVVWYGDDGSDDEIYWVSIDTLENAGTVQKISVHEDNINRDDWYPQIAADQSGDSYVTWMGHDGQDYEIFWVRMHSGTPGQVYKVSTHSDNQTRTDYYPQIAADGTGNSYITWQGYDGSDNDIYWVAVSGDVPGDVQKISTHEDTISKYDYTPQIVADSDGNSFVTWKGFDGRDDEVYWVPIDGDGVPGTAEKLSIHTENETRDDWSPQIATDGSGKSYVVWQGWDGTDWEVYFTAKEGSGNGDSDGDGIPDELDSCPEENPQGLDADQNGCTDRICDLADLVRSLDFHKGLRNSLAAKAENACMQYTRGNITPAVNMLNAFIHEVEAQRGKKISEEDAELLIQFALNAQLGSLEDTTSETETETEPASAQTNNQMSPLAQHNLSKAQKLSAKAHDLLSEANEKGIDVSEAEELMEKAEQLLSEAAEHLARGNCVTANTLALEAADLYEKAIELLEQMLS